jgi:hypothetical protein
MADKMKKDGVEESKVFSKETLEYYMGLKCVTYNDWGAYRVHLYNKLDGISS